MREELKKALDKHIDISGKAVYVWGTGHTAMLYQEGLIRLEKEGILHITGYVDNNSSKWGQVFFNKPVIAPDELLRQSDACVLISSPQPHVINAIKQQLLELHVEGYHIDEVILQLHMEDVLKCYDLLDDMESQKTYAHIIKCRVEGLYPKEEYVSSEPFFLLKNYRKKDPKEVFIDCGAFVGDSIERYIWKKDGIFKKIIAFEPDSGSYKALEKRCNRLKEEWNISPDRIEIYPYGVGDNSSYLKVERDSVNNGLGTTIVENAMSGDCRIIAIDDFIKEPFSFLKADIEGYEYKMLLGAQVCIAKYHPLLVVCIYHNAADLYDIPLLIKSIAPEYKMKIRHHSDFLEETILYAWTE